MGKKTHVSRCPEGAENLSRSRTVGGFWRVRSRAVSQERRGPTAANSVIQE